MKARFFEPMLLLAVPKLPEGPEWQLELKLDGYWGIGIKSNGRAQTERLIDNRWQLHSPASFTDAPQDPGALDQQRTMHGAVGLDCAGVMRRAVEVDRAHAG